MIPMLFLYVPILLPNAKVNQRFLRNVHCFYTFSFSSLHIAKKQQEELCTSPASVPLKKHIIVLK